MAFKLSLPSPSSLFKSIRTFLSIPETENSITVGMSGTAQDRDRYPYNRTEILEQSLEAWRNNPLARRMIGLTTQYVVGGGIDINSDHRRTDKFIHEFWNNPLNHMHVRSVEWCDELSRTGNLFILLTTDAAGMSYVRAIPASMVEEIISRENDIEQPVTFIPKATLNDLNPQPWPAYNQNDDSPSPLGEGQGRGSHKPVMLHYAINRPSGAQWGEPDLAPVLRWLSRYSNWLEDRARLNRYRNSFLFTVKSKFTSEAQRIARQNALNANPPQPGSILVSDENETWEVISPKLEASDALNDGLALKKMIAAGAGIPMHFLAEPEGSTRTTAEAAGGPTFRYYEQRQEFYTWLLADIIRVIVRRRAYYDRMVKVDAEINVVGSDISARDNLSLANASANILQVITTLRDRGLIDDQEVLRLVYRFGGETLDVEDMLDRGKAAPPPKQPPAPQPNHPATKQPAPAPTPSTLVNPDEPLP